MTVRIHPGGGHQGNHVRSRIDRHAAVGRLAEACDIGRPPKKIALRFGAGLVPEELELAGRLDAFRDDRHAKPSA